VKVSSFTSNHTAQFKVYSYQRRFAIESAHPLWSR